MLTLDLFSVSDYWLCARTAPNCKSDKERMHTRFYLKYPVQTLHPLPYFILCFAQPW